MTRPLAPVVALLLAGPLAFAQLPPVTVTVDPAAEPRPAFRYELLVPARERVSGNAAHHYTKAALARPTRQPDDDKKLAAWDETDAGKLPFDDVKAYLKGYAAAFRELEHGTRCKACEWVAAPASGPAALADELNATQHFRELARALALRARVEMAEGKFDAAAATLRSGLQFAKHYGEGPSLIRLLVGHAMAGIFLARTDEFIACPGSPDLYWALTALPRPLIDPRPGLDGEEVLSESFLPGLTDLRKGPVEAEKALDVAEAAIKVLSAASENPNPLANLGGRLAISGQAAVHHAEAKKALLARGWEKLAVDAMPAVQAVFLNSFEAYLELADDHRKWFLAPLPESFDGLAKAAARAKKARKDQTGDALFQTFLLVLPAVEKVHQAGARTERKLAAMRVVEAVRIHAEAAASLPAALADAKKVPVPADPLTGTPFVYRPTAAGFTLTSPESESVPRALALTYEVTLRK